MALKSKIISLKEKFLESIDYEIKSNNTFDEEIVGEKENELLIKKNKKSKNKKAVKSVENEISDDRRIFLTVPVTLNICNDISALALG